MADFKTNTKLVYQKLYSVRDKLAELNVEAMMEKTKKEVPKLKIGDYNLIYYFTSDSYKIFFNNSSSERKSITLKSLEEVVDFIETKAA